MGIYTNFDPSDIVSANPTEVTVGLWSGDTGSLMTFYTSSAQASASLSSQYYWNVYQTNPDITSSVPIPEVQFAVAYGNRLGGGSPTLTQNNNSTLSTTAIYSQYRNLLLDPGEIQFTFLGNYVSDQIYVLNIERARLKETMDPGNWLLTLSGSLGLFTFIDDSGQTLSPTVGKAGNVFNVVSGNLTGPSGSTIAASQSANFGGFGLFYPSLGYILLNPNAISSSIGMVSGSFYVSGNAPFAVNTGSNVLPQYNQVGLYNAIRLGADFQARSAETISSTSYFVRVRNQNYNYSNNPSFFDETTGNLLNSTFIQNPQVYITTVGLYNDSNELLAVAKLSKPTGKSFDTELLLRVRLDW